MTDRSLQKSIVIEAPVAKVWKVFTDPSVTKLMGGSYVTDWKPGSSLGWRANSGQMYTNGKVLHVESHKVIEHTLLDMADSTKTLCTITYHFKEEGEQTRLEATETPHVHWSDQQYSDASDGWDAALKLVKDIAEGL